MHFRPPAAAAAILASVLCAKPPLPPPKTTPEELSERSDDAWTSLPPTDISSVVVNFANYIILPGHGTIPQKIYFKAN